MICCLLQWGHDKIVMEVFSVNDSDAFVNTLQWGHDKIVMEVAILDYAISRGIGASMGP